MAEPKNAPYPMEVSRAGSSRVSVKLIDSSEVAPWNALLPMLSTLAGIVMEVRSVAKRNAISPMVFTLAGIVMEVREVALSKAPTPMD